MIVNKSILETNPREMSQQLNKSSRADVVVMAQYCIFGSCSSSHGPIKLAWPIKEEAG